MKTILLCLHGWGGSKDSFSELREALNLDANRTRQSLITKEIAELVGGAEALAA